MNSRLDPRHFSSNIAEKVMARTEDDHAHRIGLIRTQFQQARGNDAAGMLSEAGFLIALGSRRRGTLSATDYVALLAAMRRAEEAAFEDLPVDFTREDILRGFEAFRSQLSAWCFGAGAVIAADAKARHFRNRLHNVELEKLIAKAETAAGEVAVDKHSHLFPSVLRVGRLGGAA